jgi:hypothetical protein
VSSRQPKLHRDTLAPKTKTKQNKKPESFITFVGFISKDYPKNLENRIIF